MSSFVKLGLLTILVLQNIFVFSQTKQKNNKSNNLLKVQKALIKSTESFEIKKYSVEYKNNFSVNGTYKQLFKIDGEINYLWQNKNNNLIYLTKYSSELIHSRDIKLPCLPKHRLLSACIDTSSFIYYLTINDSIKGKVILEMLKINKNGKLILKKQYDCSTNNLNIWQQNNYNVKLLYLDGEIGVLLARTMFASNDGSNHQGGIACIFDANSLNLTQNLGATSSHSFDNYLTKSSNGQFLALDLGDNFPRGVHLHKFSSVTGISHRIVYTFKTEHQNYQTNNNKKYPLYSEISTKESKFYKWSNDNNTYSELGGIIEAKDSYLVFFIGQPDPNGKCLNNSRTNSMDPGNIAYVKVRKDFEKASFTSKNEVTDDLIMSKGAAENGGFYDYQGNWNKQRNKGIVWLTNYKENTNESATKLKVCILPNEEIALIWENNNNNYLKKLNFDGKELSPIIDLGNDFKMNYRDEFYVEKNTLFLPHENSLNKKLEVIYLEIK